MEDLGVQAKLTGLRLDDAVDPILNVCTRVRTRVFVFVV